MALIAFRYQCYNLLGRVLTGFPIGGNSAPISVYISDMAPKESKGVYGSIFIHACISGVLCSHLLGAFISFRWLALVPVVVLLLQNLILSWQPYSPKWLAARGLEKDALNTLKYEVLTTIISRSMRRCSGL